MNRKRRHAATSRPLAALTVGTASIIAAAYIAAAATACRLALRHKLGRETC
jgi:hypothetical protein